MAYPLVVMLVAFSFAGILLVQFRRRRKPHQFVWALALAMGGLAALFFVLFLGDGRNEVFFKLYYVWGALLMAAFLGLGEVYLLMPRRTADRITVAVVLVGAVGFGLVLAATPNSQALHGPNVLAGTKVIEGPSVLFIAILNTFGAVAVIGGAAYSAWRLLQHQGPLRLLVANVLIAAGTILASLAGTLARLTGNESSFWSLLASGFIILFTGFLLTTRRIPRPAPTLTPEAGRTAS